MSKQVSVVIRIFAILSLAAFIPQLCAAQDSSGGGSLQDQIIAQFKLTKVGADSSGVSVTEAGDVFKLQKGGVLGVANSAANTPMAIYKDGDIHPPSVASRVGFGLKNPLDPRAGVGQKDTKQFPSGWKVYITKIEVKQKDERVVFTLYECDSCNNTNPPTTDRAQLAFQFPKGYLETGPDAGQIVDVVNQALTKDTDSQQQAGDQNQGQAQGGAQPAADQQAAAPAPAPVPISIGQTIDQVQANTSNGLQLVADLGDKKIYKYGDLKVTFVKGKVTDVQ
jgi:hypothetical protein